MALQRSVTFHSSHHIKSIRNQEKTQKKEALIVVAYTNEKKKEEHQINQIEKRKTKTCSIEDQNHQI